MVRCKIRLLVLLCIFIGTSLCDARWTPGNIEKMSLQDLAMYGLTKEVKARVAQGADVNAENPLQIAAANGYKKIVVFLLANGAKVNAKDEHGETPLHGAARLGHNSVIRVRRSTISVGSSSNHRSTVLLSPRRHVGPPTASISLAARLKSFASIAYSMASETISFVSSHSLARRRSSGISSGLVV